MMPRQNLVIVLFLFSIACLFLSFQNRTDFQENFQSLNPPAIENAKIKVVGTGRTIGNVLLLEVTNKDKNKPLRFTVGPSYVPGSRKSQPYIIPGTTVVDVPPGGSVTVPIDGICIDPERPPLGTGSGGPKFEDWIVIKPLPEDWSPNPTTGWNPDPQNPVLNPITEEPIGHTIDLDKNPEEVAPVIAIIVESIITTYDELFASGDIITPLTDNPVMQRELVIQQLVWRTVSHLTGNPYTIDDFQSRVSDLFPEEEQKVLSQENLDQGIEDFWGMFTMVGVEAKVLKGDINPNLSSNTPSSSSPSSSECVSGKINSNKDTLVIKIANTGDKFEREEYVKAFRSAANEVIRAISDGNKSDTIDIGFSSSQMPASAFSFFISQAIGARSNGTAFMVDNQNLLSSVMTTEPVETYAKGFYQVTLSHAIGRNCRSDIIGVNMAVLQADSEVNATMNNPAVLKIINAVGEIAIDFVVTRGRGSVKKLSEYIKEKIKDMPKDFAKEQIKDFLKDIHEKTKDMDEEETEDYLDNLLNELKKNNEDSIEDDAVDVLAEWFAELMVEKDLKEAVEDKIISDLTPAPIDFSPIQTNTYALVEGNLNIWLDDINKKLRTASAVQYERESFESNETAIRGGNQYCDAGVITRKTTSGQITAKTEGNSMSKAEATGQGLISTGHGRATASLESINSIFIIMICTCNPGGVTYETFLSTSSYYEAPFIGNIHQAVISQKMNSIKQEVDKEIERYNDDPTTLNGELLKDFIDSLEEKMKETALAASRIIQSCQ